MLLKNITKRLKKCTVKCLYFHRETNRYRGGAEEELQSCCCQSSVSLQTPSQTNTAERKTRCHIYTMTTLLHTMTLQMNTFALCRQSHLESLFVLLYRELKSLRCFMKTKILKTFSSLFCVTESPSLVSHFSFSFSRLWSAGGFR